MKNWDLYHCPSTGGQWGYAYNGALAGEAVPAAPSELPMVYDSTNPAKNAHDLVESLPRPGRHKGKDNVAYADGHARAVTLP